MDYSQKQKEKVMTQLTTIDTDNYAAMAKAMGIAHEKTSTSSSSLARLRINHSPIMGTADVNGKKVNVEVVEGGTYTEYPMEYLQTIENGRNSSSAKLIALQNNNNQNDPEPLEIV